MTDKKDSLNKSVLQAADLEQCQKLSIQRPLVVQLSESLHETTHRLQFKLLTRDPTLIILSDVVPILENMGLRILSEKSFEMTLDDESSIYLNDYQVVYKRPQTIALDQIQEAFQEAFYKIWTGDMDNDGFNYLILYGGLNWREVTVLRAYAKYLWQIGFNFSQDFLEETLIENSKLTRLLIDFFKVRFSIETNEQESELALEESTKRLMKELNQLKSLNDDKIFRHYFKVIGSTLRTNYYQFDLKGDYKPYLSFKFKSSELPDLPKPVPLYEIFVYSPKMEGIHLRMSKVSRGGIRFSDRTEDFRTEILGLMKTQQVKNVVTVPTGAKGGFIIKKVPKNSDPHQIKQAILTGYEYLIRGLLDLTDNDREHQLIRPKNVRCYDDSDPYLVVAADKGTATFSDFANDLASEYDFWLGDAFASGGKNGYDHKKMAITARGVWESIQTHFYNAGISLEKPFTVIGIGDMSGDVFGNGLLLSKNMRLIAAFNHRDIFLDPNPDPQRSYDERARLFKQAASNWSDYDPTCLSKGGGVFSRSCKRIPLSPAVQQALTIKETELDPESLIRAILKAPVDLLWNGGIGTYVKHTHESSLEVGDKSNDAIRINGCDLKVKIVAEGGNLGFTQLGRIEYAAQGGCINTDAIDNSGGVQCSDYEVNLKILLNEAEKNQQLTRQQRNDLLEQLEPAIAALVLKNNTVQSQAISISVFQAAENLEMYVRVIEDLVRDFKLDRVLENLPNEKEIEHRKTLKQGLTRPEMAILFAYTKMSLKAALLNSDVPEDPYFEPILEGYFPEILQKNFKDLMKTHRLKREIIATYLSNDLMNEMGVSFVTRLQDETGNPPEEIVRAYMIAKKIFKASELKTAIYQFNGQLNPEIQYQMIHEVNRLIRRATRWFLRGKPKTLHLESTVQRFLPNIETIENTLAHLLSGYDEEARRLIAFYQTHQVPPDLSLKIASLSALFSALDIASAAFRYELPVEQLALIYYEIGERLALGTLRSLIKKQPVHDQWEALARARFIDDLDKQQRYLTLNILKKSANTTNIEPTLLIEQWLRHHQILLKRWSLLTQTLQKASTLSFTIFAVVLRDLSELSLAS